MWGPRADSLIESGRLGCVSRPKSQWQLRTESDPSHSQWYIDRFKSMAAAGQDLLGEARTVDAMAPRGGRILDAGAGPGRLGGELAKRGHEVYGIDVDPILVQEARREHPDVRWEVGDISDPDLPVYAELADIDVVLCAGNVVTFMAPGTQAEALRIWAQRLAPRGRIIVGFGLDRGYPLEQFRADVAAAGLEVHSEHSTWELHPFSPEADGFLVAICGLPLLP